jgi:LCP family protein required for cell wall assembly
MSTFFPPRPDEDDHDADFGRRARRGLRWPLALLGTVALLVLGALSSTALYVGSIDRSLNSNLQRAETLPPELPTAEDGAPRPPKVTRNAVNFVILGSDSRTPGQPGTGRSDALMIAHLSGDRRSAVLISFPRDLWVPIPGHGKNKINAAFALGGSQLTVRTLEGLLDTRMDHVAVVDFDGFMQVTEDLGGVTLDNPDYSRAGPWEFPVGPVTVGGDQALAYVRERKQLPRGDLDRAERQRLVVKAILRKMLSKDVLANPLKLNRAISTVAQGFTVDRNLTSAEIRRTALSVRFTPDEVRSVQAPIARLGTSRNGQSIDVVDQGKLEVLAKALRDDNLDSFFSLYPRG